jgi:hypothetical protein
MHRLCPVACLTLACVALPLARPARAANEIDKHTANVPTAAYLHVEPGLYHPQLTRRGNAVGPGFLALDLEAAVHGVPAAEAEARRAVHLSVARLAFAVATAACIGVSVANHLEHRNDVAPPTWPVLGLHGIDLVNLGAVVGAVGAGFSGSLANRAVTRSVNIYHYSLLESVVSQFD